MIQLDTLDCVNVITIWQKMDELGVNLRVDRLIQYAAKFGTTDMMAFINFCELNSKDPGIITETIYHDLRDMNESQFLPRTNGYADATED
jgi:hypothetical protein